MCPYREDQRYQSVRIIAVYETDQVPIIPSLRA